MKKLFLSLISHIPVSRAFGRLVRLRRPRCLVRLVIRCFAGFYGINMAGYRGALADYPSLLEFFIRALDPETRPLKTDPGLVLSPVDGTLASLQCIDSDRALQVKGWSYPVSELVGASEPWAEGWWLATIYLSPADYHRYHYPLDGRLESLHHMGARLYPVNAMGVSTIEKLFVKNERVVACFASRGHRYYVTAVGATFVGSIKMEAHPEPFRPGCREACDTEVGQLEEMGRFELGSTIVLLLPKTMATPIVEPGGSVSVGDPLFRLTI